MHKRENLNDNIDSLYDKNHNNYQNQSNNNTLMLGEDLQILILTKTKIYSIIGAQLSLFEINTNFIEKKNINNQWLCLTPHGGSMNCNITIHGINTSKNINNALEYWQLTMLENQACDHIIKLANYDIKGSFYVKKFLLRGNISELQKFDVTLYSTNKLHRINKPLSTASI